MDCLIAPALCITTATENRLISVSPMKWTVIQALALITLVLFWPPGAPVCSALSPPAGQALLISDIHFDPLADPAILKQLIAAPVAQWPDIFATSTRTAYARFPADTNYPLLKSALAAAAAQRPFDFVIGSGDYLRHNFQRAFVKAGGLPSDFPAFSVLHYDVVTGDISDIATYYLDLAGNGKNPQWALEYRFSTAYGYSALTAENLEDLAVSIHDNPDVRQTFAGHYAASAPSPITPTNWPFYSCAETQFTVTDYINCVCNTLSNPNKSEK
jgi:hypothetical protein